MRLHDILGAKSRIDSVLGQPWASLGQGGKRSQFVERRSFEQSFLRSLRLSTCEPQRHSAFRGPPRFVYRDQRRGSCAQRVETYSKALTARCGDDPSAKRVPKHLFGSIRSDSLDRLPTLLCRASPGHRNSAGTLSARCEANLQQRLVADKRHNHRFDPDLAEIATTSVRASRVERVVYSTLNFNPFPDRVDGAVERAKAATAPQPQQPCNGPLPSARARGENEIRLPRIYMNVSGADCSAPRRTFRRLAALGKVKLGQTPDRGRPPATFVRFVHSPSHANVFNFAQNIVS